jgi:hypothetical protein
LVIQSLKNRDSGGFSVRKHASAKAKIDRKKNHLASDSAIGPPNPIQIPQHIDVTRHRAKYSYVCVPSIIVFISP